MPKEPLVCPHCGEDNTRSREKAEIWQPATFFKPGEGEEGNSDSHPGYDVEWEAYDSDDVGETETVGWACGSCCFTWDLADGFPFITREEFDAKATD